MNGIGLLSGARHATHAAVGRPGRAPLALLTPLARPPVAGVVALAVYLCRACLAKTGPEVTHAAYLNLLADAFLHGQLHLRLAPHQYVDLIHYGDRYYLYWPPLPAILIMPLVALFGATVSDVVYTAIFGALTIVLLARLLEVLGQTGIAPLSVERRAILVATMAFGSMVLILAPGAGVYYTTQILGWGFVLLATLAALARTDRTGYLLTGIALACALSTRLPLIFNGVWLAYFMLLRDRQQSLRRQAGNLGAGLTPIAVAIALLGWYNWGRFGNPLDSGLAWQVVGGQYRADLAQYGQFSLHYVPQNLYYHFIAYTTFADDRWMGGGLFWMTPVLLGAPYALWRHRDRLLVWMLALSCLLVYLPSAFLIGTGFYQFGPRYLLDLMVPLLVLTMLGIRHWPLKVLQCLLLISIFTYASGSLMWWFTPGW